MQDEKTNKPQEEYKGELVALAADFGRLYVRRHNGKLLQPVEAKMTLSKAKGHLYEVKGKTAITSGGFIYLNKVASINLVTPPRISVDGIEQPNPYVERDDRKMVLTVNVRKIAVGYSPAGNVTVLDKSLYYNIYTYLIQSFQSAMKKQKADKPVVVMGTVDDRPAVKGKSKWAFFITTPPLGLWVDYKSAAIESCIEEHTQRQRFGDRIAQKIVERNLLKDHPAIGISQVTPTQGKATVTVYGYRHVMTTTEIDDISDRAAAGQDIEAEVKAEVVEPAPEEEKEVVAEAAEEGKADEPQKPEPEKSKKTPGEMKDPSEDPEFGLFPEEKEKK